MLMPLTRRQREIYDWLHMSIALHGFAPSIVEICEHFQLTSLATVHKHLVNLTNKGYIVRRWNMKRSIQLVVQGEFCPTCGRAISEEPTSEDLHERA